jgi:hypothetical protein
LAVLKGGTLSSGVLGEYMLQGSWRISNATTWWLGLAGVVQGETSKDKRRREGGEDEGREEKMDMYGASSPHAPAHRRGREGEMWTCHRVGRWKPMDLSISGDLKAWRPSREGELWCWRLEARIMARAEAEAKYRGALRQ